MNYVAIDIKRFSRKSFSSIVKKTLEIISQFMVIPIKEVKLNEKPSKYRMVIYHSNVLKRNKNHCSTNMTFFTGLYKDLVSMILSSGFALLS